jgi:hypothetical protein
MTTLDILVRLFVIAAAVIVALWLGNRWFKDDRR